MNLCSMVPRYILRIFVSRVVVVVVVVAAAAAAAAAAGTIRIRAGDCFLNLVSNDLSRDVAITGSRWPVQTSPNSALRGPRTLTCNFLRVFFMFFW